MNCPSCGSPHTSVEFDNDGLINNCAECESRWKATGDFTVEQETPRAEPPQLPQAKRQIAPVRGGAKAINPKTLVQQAKLRVVELDREIKRLSRLMKERDELKRLIAAAKTSGEATNVRPIRAAQKG
jgi:hypothetical protein